MIGRVQPAEVDLVAAPADVAGGLGASPVAGVAVAGLYKAFGDHPVLQGVDLEIPDGSITAILGSSGSGKTTLLRLLAGFSRPDRGTITIGGRLVDGAGPRVGPESRGVGYVPQEGSLFPHLDVKGNIGFGVPRSRRRHKVGELLDLIGLSGLGDRYPHQLSGGQQQRVALARALARDPSVVLLDEPFSSLDAALRATVRRDIGTILAQTGMTTVIVTHDQDEAFSIATKVAVLRGGRVAQAGPPALVYAAPVDADMAGFVGEANLIDGTVRGAWVETVFGPLALSPDASVAAGAAVTVLLRPEQISLDEGKGTGGVGGLVVDREYHGHDCLIKVSVSGRDGGGTSGGLAVTVRSNGVVSPGLGSPVTLRSSGTVMAWERTS